MALTPPDFISPTGDLEPNYWPEGSPGGSTTERLDAWITEGYGRVAGLPADQQDAANTHFVYAKAYRALASRFAAVPSSASQAGISHTISQGQIAFWEREAARHEALLEGYLEAPAPSSTAKRVTKSVKTTAVW